MTRGSLRLQMRAVDGASAVIRHTLGSFLTALAVGDERRDDIVTATGEALANAIEHAYFERSKGDVTLFARADSGEDRLTIEVADDGRFRPVRTQTARGFGLRIIRAVAETVEVDTSAGTSIRMVFALQRVQV